MRFQKIVPVLDLKDGHVVRGVAGRRYEYRPIESRLVKSSEPVAVANALRELGLSQFYVADLDAIGGMEPAWKTYRKLVGCGIHLWIDAGMAGVERAEQFMAFARECPRVTGIVAGLESLSGPKLLASMLDRIGAERLIFSLDLKDGKPLTNTAEWDGQTAEQIAEAAIQLGVRRMIVLDLAGVGVGAGVSTLSLCRSLRDKHPDLELTSGGGVRGEEDLHALFDAGCNAALVASALHDGRITREMIDRIDTH